MEISKHSSSFKLSTGGLYYQLLLRLKLVEPTQYHFWRRAILFSGITWLPLLILTSANGTVTGNYVDISFIQDPVPHSRFLVALPLLIFADNIIDPYVAGIVNYFRTSGLIPDKEKNLYTEAIDQLSRQKNMIAIDLALLALALSVVWFLKIEFEISTLDIGISSWISTNVDGAEKLTPAGWWLVLISIPVIQFIFYRWVWRFIIWIRSLNRISRIRLMLQPTHPDQMGGLGILASGQISFGIVFVCNGILFSSEIASQIIHAQPETSFIYAEMLGFILISFMIVTAPLCTFITPLRHAKRVGLMQHSALARIFSDVFYKNWIDKSIENRNENSAIPVDPSALADYGAIFGTVKSMHLIPLNRQNIAQLIIALSTPFIPLILIKLSFTEIMIKFAKTLI